MPTGLRYGLAWNDVLASAFFSGKQMSTEENMSKRSMSVLVGAATLALGATALMSTPAAARTFERCDADGDHCVRIKCDHDGDRCWKESEYADREYYRRPGRWVCDSDGDRCHYEYTGHRWNPHWDHEHEHDDDGR